MSFISRQRVRQRMNNRMVSSPSSPSLVIPSIEESLQNWTRRDSTCSTLAWLLDSCRCCNKSHCENLETFVYAIRKLEDDARLAAEIGQSLLHKHEQYVADSDGVKSRLEEQVFEAQERVVELEQLLIQSDTVKHGLEQEKSKLAWEWQKTQKTLDETLADMEACNQRSNQLTNELDTKTREVEKLRTYKLMARQADVREDNLRSALEDMKQELAVSRKAELSLDSKYKKLKSKYDSICGEKLKREQEKQNVENEKKKSKLSSGGLKESNDTLRRDINKQIASALLFSDSKTLPPVIETNDHLVELVKDLVSTNNKLKTDLQESKDLLLESRSESMNLLAKLEQEEQDKVVYDDDDTMTEQDIWPKESTSNTTCNSMDPSAVVHHHYHYHVRNKNKASALPKEPETSPCRQLYHQICLLQERLQQSDTRALNRKLRRVFDIFDLSSMSNSIIENILRIEVNGLPQTISSTEEEFLLLIQVVQDMLKEIGQLRININDLQVEYVKKVEESEVRIAQEIQKKQERAKKVTALTWLSSVFQKSASSQKIQHYHRLPSPPPVPATAAIYVHTNCPTAILIPSNPNVTLTEDYSSKVVRCNGPSSSYPTRSPCNNKRLAINYPLRSSQSTNTAQKSTGLKKKRSSMTINSTDATGWLGNKINQ